MKRVTVTELKNRLSEYLRMVKRGESIEVLERSRPIARIEGIGTGALGINEDLDRLAAAGLVVRARRRAEDRVLEPPVECQADAVQASIEERGDR